MLCFKHDINVCARVVNALILLPVVNLSLKWIQRHRLARCTGAGSDPRRGDAADWRHSAPALINLTLIKLAKPSSAAFRVSN